MARGRLHTTTVRFDADTWTEIVAESDRLGIAHASEELSDYMLASRARDLLEHIAAPLSIAGVEIASGPGVESVWPDVERTVASALEALGIRSSPARHPSRTVPAVPRRVGAPDSSPSIESLRGVVVDGRLGVRRPCRFQCRFRLPCFEQPDAYEAAVVPLVASGAACALRRSVGCCLQQRDRQRMRLSRL
jgi:hypothetical protein